MILALLLAQVIVPTPVPISATPTPAPLSERALLARGLDDASAKAKALGGTLGAVVIDLTNGSSAQVEGDRSLPMQRMQNLLIAASVYRHIDDGSLRADQHVRVRDREYSLADATALMVEQDDNAAASALLLLAGGADTVNARLRDLGYDGMFVAANDEGYAKPLVFARFLSDLQAGKLLARSSQSALLGMLAKSAGSADAATDAEILDATGHHFVIVAMLQGARGDKTGRDAVLAAVRRAAHDAALTFQL